MYVFLVKKFFLSIFDYVVKVVWDIYFNDTKSPINLIKLDNFFFRLCCENLSSRRKKKRNYHKKRGKEGDQK